MAEYHAPWKHEMWHGLHHTVIDARGNAVAFDILTEDDALLIKAAPLLLEALEAVEWVSRQSYCPWCGGGRIIGHEPECPRQAAIAAARGEERE